MTRRGRLQRIFSNRSGAALLAIMLARAIAAADETIAQGGPNASANLDQCQNGTLANLATPCGQTPTKWANGDVNQQNSQYREADGLPYRNFVSGLTDGTWVIRLEYDFTKGGIYAIDRLTRFNLTQNSNPCLNTATGFACTMEDEAFEFEMPAEVALPGATAPALANGGALDIAGAAGTLTAADATMRVWVQGGTASFVSAGQNAPAFDDGYVLQSGLSTADSSREFAFRVTVAGCPTAQQGGCSLMMGWSAHIAAAKDWGEGNGASSITGAPFHMQISGVDQVNGTSGGNQDRSVQLSAIVETGSIVIIKSSQPSNGQDFAFTGTLGDFTLDDDDGADATRSDTQTFTGQAGGIYTVAEATLPADWAVFDIECSDPTSNTTFNIGTASASIDLEAGEVVTCTFKNRNDTLLNLCLHVVCDDGNACTANSCDPSTGQCVYTPDNTASCDDGLFCNGAEVCSDGQCTAPADTCAGGQVCDESGDRCVECVTDAQCGSEVCEVDTGICVQCVNDATCGPGAVCSDANTCVQCENNDDCSGDAVCELSTNICVECNTSADCTGDEVCEPSSNLCVPCLGDEHCSNGAVCELGTNTCVECNTSADCTGEEVCDVAANECVQCVGDEDCGGDAVCNESTNTCVACQENADCSGGAVCEVGTNTCVECNTSADCTGDEVCDVSANECVQCVADEQCGGDAVCHATTKTCVECVDTGDCSSGEVCNPVDNACTECVGDSDCSDTPDTPLCNEDTNTCVACVGDESCGENVCNVVDGVCVECVNSDDCSAELGGLICDEGSSTCVECQTDESCTNPDAPLCDVESKTCVECLTNESCDEGLVCETSNGSCVECLTNDDCSEEATCNTETNTCVECLSDTDCSDGSSCTADTCNETGQCEYAAVECSVVTDSSLCQFGDPAGGACEGREFRLVYTPDVNVWPGYKLSSSNPGQTFYNLVSVGDATTQISVPYPYVTVGAMPVHVYCADDLTIDANGCLVPPAAVAAYPLQISLADWGSGGRCAAQPPMRGVDGYPELAGSCALDVPLPVDQCGGKFYVNVHLDYGLEGRAADGADGDTLPDRYDAVNASTPGNYDAYVNVNAPDAPTVVAINECTPYRFADSGSGLSDTVFSTNSFKRIAGVFGQALDSQSGNPLPGVAGRLVGTFKTGLAVVATTTTDVDGYLMLNYKHTGKPATYTIVLTIPGIGEVTKSVILKANGWAEASYDVFTNTWFVAGTGSSQ